MPRIVTITQLETAINRLREIAPPVNYVLSPDLRVMAEIYGGMIFAHAELIDLEQQPDALRQVVFKWLPTRVEAPNVCTYRTGDPGADCEACQ